MDCGEMLLHGRADLDFDVSYSMPLAAVSSAYLYGHAGPEASRWAWGASATALAALTFGLGALLGGWAAGAAALALTVPFSAEILRFPINSLYALAVLVAAGLLVRRSRAPTPVNGALLGLALGLTLLHRSPLLFFPFLLAALDAVPSNGPRPGIRGALPVLVVPFLLLLPWIAMNWTLHGEFVPIERGRLQGLLLGAIHAVNKEDVALGLFAGGAGGRGGALAACAGRLSFIVLSQPALFLAAAAGLFLGRRRAEFRALGLLVAYFTAVHCGIALSEAYLVPLWPLLAALAAGALPVLLKRPPAAAAGARAPAELAFLAVLAVTGCAGLFALDAVATYPRRLASAPVPGEAPDESWPLVDAGRRSLARGEIDDAYGAFSRAAALRPQETRTRFYLAWAEALRGRPASLMSLDPATMNRGVGRARGMPFLKAAEHLRAGRGAEARAEIEAGLATVEFQAHLPARDRAAAATPVPLLEPLAEFLRPMAARDRERLLRAIAAASAPGRGADVRLELARLAVERGDRVRARADLTELERPGATSAALTAEEGRRLAAQHRKAGDSARAAAVLEEILRRFPADADLRLERAELAAATGKRDEALESLARVEALPSMNDERQRRVVTLYRELKEPRRASAFLGALAESRPRDAGLWVERAELALEAREPEAARAALSRAGDLSPDAGALRRIAAVEAKLKTLRRALEPAKAPVKALEQNAGVWISRAESAADAGEREAALEALARAEAFPADGVQSRRLVSLHRRLKNPGRAAALLGDLIRRSPADAEPLIELADLAAEKGSRDEALESLARAEALVLSDGQARRAAALERTLKNPVRAAALLDELIRRSPPDAELLLSRAELALEAGELEAARRTLAGAAGLKPGGAALLRMAVVYGGLRDFTRALELTGAPGSAFLRDPEFWITRAEFAAGAGERETGRESLARAEALPAGDESPDDERRRRIALAYQSLKDYPRALEIFSSLARKHPAAASFYSDKALCEHLQGAGDAALADLRTAIRLEPKFLPAYLTLGAVHAARGRIPEALKAYDEALSNTAAADGDPLREAVLAARKGLVSNGAAAGAAHE